MLDLIRQVCPRCHSASVEIDARGHFACKDCGKADTADQLWLSFPDEGARRNRLGELMTQLFKPAVSGAQLMMGETVRVMDLKFDKKDHAQHQQRLIDFMQHLTSTAQADLFTYVLPYLPPEDVQACLEIRQLVAKYEERATAEKVREAAEKEGQNVVGREGEHGPQAGDGIQDDSMGSSGCGCPGGDTRRAEEDPQGCCGVHGEGPCAE